MSRLEVHRDETPCPANERDPQPCPLVGTGVHEPIADHLKRAHHFTQGQIEIVRETGNLCLDGAEFAHPDVEALFRIHEQTHFKTQFTRP